MEANRESPFASLRRFRFRKRRYVVSIESPSGTTGFPHRVRAWDEDDALRHATYYWSQHCNDAVPYYEWHYKVIA